MQEPFALAVPGEAGKLAVADVDALEARSPFLDRELMEYVFMLPDTMRFRWGQTKYLLRRSFADLVPPEILRRGKMGFGVPLQAWFASDLREYLYDTTM